MKFSDLSAEEATELHAVMRRAIVDGIRDDMDAARKYIDTFSVVMAEAGFAICLAWSDDKGLALGMAQKGDTTGTFVPLAEIDPSHLIGEVDRIMSEALVRRMFG